MRFLVFQVRLLYFRGRSFFRPSTSWTPIGVHEYLLGAFLWSTDPKIAAFFIESHWLCKYSVLPSFLFEKFIPLFSDTLRRPICNDVDCGSKCDRGYKWLDGKCIGKKTLFYRVSYQDVRYLLGNVTKAFGNVIFITIQNTIHPELNYDTWQLFL